MFNDPRSKSVIFIAHCILNQNSISDGTADFAGCISNIAEYLSSCNVGIIQMPCPELHCLGLDRGDAAGYTRPVVYENTRIRKILSGSASMQIIEQLVQHTVFQILEYRKYGFDIKGIVGINRSPSCGVDTTSKNNREVNGEGIFIEALRNALIENSTRIKIVGIKASETEKAVATVKKLVDIN